MNFNRKNMLICWTTNLLILFLQNLKTNKGNLFDEDIDYNDTFFKLSSKNYTEGFNKIYISKVFYDNAIHGKSKLRVFGRPLDVGR